MTIKRYGRFWAVYDETAGLICVCVYKKGAQEVVRRIEAAMQQLMAAHAHGCNRQGRGRKEMRVTRGGGKTGSG